MAGYQYTIIIGNVGREPEMRYTQSGVAVCDFSVAVRDLSITLAAPGGWRNGELACAQRRTRVHRWKHRHPGAARRRQRTYPSEPEDAVLMGSVKQPLVRYSRI
jgi:hypothetical protein